MYRFLSFSVCNISTSKLQYGDTLNICTYRKVMLGFDELRVVSDLLFFKAILCVPAITHDHWYNLLPFYNFHNILLLLQFKEMCLESFNCN